MKKLNLDCDLKLIKEELDYMAGDFVENFLKLTDEEKDIKYQEIGKAYCNLVISANLSGKEVLLYGTNYEVGEYITHKKFGKGKITYVNYENDRLKAYFPGYDEREFKISFLEEMI